MSAIPAISAIAALCAAPHPAFFQPLLQTKHLPKFTLGPPLRHAWVALGWPKGGPSVTQTQSQDAPPSTRGFRVDGPEIAVGRRGPGSPIHVQCRRFRPYPSPHPPTRILKHLSDAIPRASPGFGGRLQRVLLCGPSCPLWLTSCLFRSWSESPTLPFCSPSVKEKIKVLVWADC